MSSIVQWIIVVALILLIYFGYVHSRIKCMRSNEVHVGMTESQVRRLIGSPYKTRNVGKLKVAIYINSIMRIDDLVRQDAKYS